MSHLFLFIIFTLIYGYLLYKNRKAISIFLRKIYKIIWNYHITHTNYIDYNKLEGTTITSRNIDIIKKIASQKSLRRDDVSISLYNKGMIYDYYMGDSKNAMKYYMESLNSLSSSTPKKNFIIDKIRNRIKINKIKEYDDKYTTISSIDVLEHTLNETINNIKKDNDMKKIERIRKMYYHNPFVNPLQQEYDLNHPKIETPIIRPKVIIDTPPKENTDKKLKDQKEFKQEWIIDTQNVHDHLLNEQMLEQFNIMKLENKNLPIMSLYQIGDCISKIKDISSTTKQNIDKLLKYIQPKDQKIMKLGQITEEEYIGILFNRILTSKNKDQLLNVFLSNMKDCWNNGSPVCVTGRITRYLSSFAHLDENPKIGILKTYQSLKNEIFGKAGKIQTDIVEKLDSTELEKYNKGINQETDKRIKDEILNMINVEYSKLYPKSILDDIIKDMDAI